MVIARIYGKFGITYKPRTMRRIPNLNYSCYKPRLIPEKSATLEEFKQAANRQIVQPIKQGHTVLGMGGAACRKWSSGGYGWRPKGGDDTVDVSFSDYSQDVWRHKRQSPPHIYG